MSGDGEPVHEGRNIRNRGVSWSSRQVRSSAYAQDHPTVNAEDHDVPVEPPIPRSTAQFDHTDTWDGPDLNLLIDAKGDSFREEGNWESMFDVGDEELVRSPHDGGGGQAQPDVRDGPSSSGVPRSGPAGTKQVRVNIPTVPRGVRRHTNRNRAGRFAQSSGGSCNAGNAGTGRGVQNKRKHGADDAWRVRGPICGGPQDDLVIPSFGGHVAVDVWNGKERGMLRCHSRANLCKQLLATLPECSAVVQARIGATGLSHLPASMFKYLDMTLISAFVERWQPDTNSFHMPFGEMTVLLHDVEMILGIPIEGGCVASTMPLEVIEERSAELFGKDVETFVRENWNGGNIDGQEIMERCLAVGQSDNFQFMCYMLTLFSSTLFVDKTGSKVRSSLLPLVESQLSWGSATLAYLYLQVGIASRANARGLCGCCTLLQAWIYEYFPMFRPRCNELPPLTGRASRWYSGEKMGKDPQRLMTIRRQLDALQADQVD